MNPLKNTFLITLLLFSSMLVASEIPFSEKLNRLRTQMGELNTQDELYNIDFEKDDFSNIIKWTKLAAEQGATWALDQLGAMFFYGIGVEQDYEKSFECYQQVAAKG
ncbi:MAG: sel1 repeat family protein, partial [Simkania sp.]|nr:sel1 repeat family protein [Simkania sp.]